MKHNRLLLIASGALVISAGMMSCSQSERSDEPLPEDANAIRFAATADQSRSDITSSNINTFNVYAFTNMSGTPNVFMDNVTVTKTGTNLWTYSPTAYWPAKEKVSFYAFSPASWVGDTSPLEPIPYDSYPGQQDIVYAVSPGLTGNQGQPNAQVVFNFRHALSKISIMLSSTDAKLDVRITNVVVVGMKTRGNFHFPHGSTDDDMTADNVGKWTGQNTPIVHVIYMARALTEQLHLTSTPLDLNAYGEHFGAASYFIPQPLVWNDNGTNNDTYIAITGSVYSADSGDKLWPNANTPEENIVQGSTLGDGVLRFPLSTSAILQFHPGCHYIYNMVVNSNKEMGSIEFGTPSVDTFVDVESNIH